MFDLTIFMKNILKMVMMKIKVFLQLNLIIFY